MKQYGSPTATLLALCGLCRYDVTQPIIQQALERSDAIDVLINVLEADDQKCKVMLAPKSIIQLVRHD